MKIPQEIAEKVRQYIEHNKLAKANFADVENWLKENTIAEGVGIEEIFITDKPTGSKQFGDEYCEQWTVYCEDDYRGNYYHQIENSDEYVGYYYEC